MSETQASQFDILILGAGVVGLAIACALKESGLRVALIDAKTPRSVVKDSYDQRVFAINQASVAFFKRLGVWEWIAQARVSPFQFMEVWDATGSGDIAFNCHEVAASELGFIIEQQVLLAALQQPLATNGELTCYYNCAVSELHESAEAITVVTKQGQRLTGRLLVGADGANSWVRQQAKLLLAEQAYDHHALVATIRTEQSHGQTARQRFMSKGPLALLPLADPNLCSIVWSTEPKHAGWLHSLPEATFNHHLTAGFGGKLGALSLESDRVCFPLLMRHARQYCRGRVVLAGDAAHTLHPLAGLGLNLGLQDAKALAEAISLAQAKTGDPATYRYLRAYERARKAENAQLIALMAGFKNLFASESSVIRIARNWGLTAVNKFTPVKNQLIRAAMGV